jgi:hypothetical protein
MPMSRKPYPSDLSDAEWEKIKPLLPGPNTLGSPRTVDLREILRRDFEELPDNHEGMVYAATIRLMLRKLTGQERKWAGSS